DKLFGGKDNDVLFGGSGSDIFVLESVMGKDLIVDFQDGTDFLALGSSLSFDDLSITDSKSGALIKDTANNSTIAFVRHVEAMDITADDFTTL
ncbi:MAG: hypothetical protein AAFV28_10260, partial [Cyanobacteria bacterium J06635_13]